jgi:tight adherence protein C
MESLLVSGSVFVAVTTIILVFWWIFAAQKVLRERLTPSGVVAADGAPTILRAGVPSANVSLLDECTAALPFMPRLEHLADQAGWAGKGKVVLLAMVGLALCGGLIGGLRFGHWFGALVCAAIAGPLPIPYLQFRRAKRMEKFTEQFPEALDMITRALRTGYAVGPAFQMVTEDMPDPVASEFRRVFEQITLGRPVTETLQDLHKRMQTEDVRFFYVAVGIQREVGGNLAEILEKLRALQAFGVCPDPLGTAEGVGLLRCRESVRGGLGPRVRKSRLVRSSVDLEVRRAGRGRGNSLAGDRFSGPETHRQHHRLTVGGHMEAWYAILAFAVVALVTGSMALLVFGRDPVRRRLQGLGDGAAQETRAASILRWSDSARPRSQWRRTLEKLGEMLLGRDVETQRARRSSIRNRLVHAGFDNPKTVPFFLGTKLLLALGFAYSYTLYGMAVQRVLPQVLLTSVVLGAIGFFLPDFWLSQRIRERQRLITNALPDVLDLLVVCVEAGMGLDAAVAKVTDPEIMGVATPLHKEMRRMHLEFRAGRPRTEAMHALGERTGVDEVRKIVAAFVQTEKLGTSLANTLRVHAETSRVRRRLRAEKQAHLAPLKMLAPIVFFLFPAFLMVMALPPLLKIREVFAP